MCTQNGWQVAALLERLCLFPTLWVKRAGCSVESVMTAAWKEERARLCVCVHGKKNVITLPHIWEDKTCTYDNHTVNLTEGQVNSTVDLVTL